MAPGQQRKLALPSSLLSELEVQQPHAGRAGRSRSQQFSRKEQRKNSRVQKRQSKQQPRTRPANGNGLRTPAARPDTKLSKPSQQSRQSKTIPSVKSRATSRIEAGSDGFSEEDGENYDDDDEDEDEDEDEDDLDDGLDSGSDSEMDGEMKSGGGTSKKPSSAVQKKLAQDSAEIAELERKLGVKGRKTLPKSFDEDGLGDLLDGLDGNDQPDGALSKRKRKSEADEWLAQKRRKAEAAAAAIAATRKPNDQDSDAEDNDEDLDSEDWGSGDDGLDELAEDDEDDDDDEEGSGDEDDNDGFEGFSENEEVEPVRSQRENPYVAPTTKVAKYIPPSLRKQSQSTNEVEAQLRRRVQGLINRLTNDSMIGITKDLLALYNNNPRQIVTSTIVDTVLVLVCSPERRPDSFFTMVAGFVAAIHRAAGMAVTAYFLQQMVEVFDKHYEAASGDQSDSTSKHLITLLAELYNMQLVGSNLIFDFVRLFLDRLSELDTELLLKVIQLCGPSLRREDSHSLRDIVNSIKPASLKGASVRTSFMMDEMRKLQSNKTKAVARNKDLVEQRSQIKKRISTLEGSRDVQPLRIGLEDIQSADKAGKWWLVGASWAGKQTGEHTDGKDSLSKKQKEKTNGGEDEDEVEDDDDDFDIADDNDDLGIPDLWALAKQQGFNTEVRQRIFVALHAATDYEHADLLVRNLRLNKHQRREIPEVVVRSGERQQEYNPFYALVAARLCATAGGGGRELAFQFRRSLTVRFARMGEEIDVDGGEGGGYGFGEEDEEEEGGSGGYDLRWLYNAARMYGTLVAGGSLRLADVLKHRNLVALRAEKAHMFVEVMLLTVLQEAVIDEAVVEGTAEEKGARERTRLKNILTGVDQDLGRGLQYFVRKKLRRSELLGGGDKKERKVLQKRCDLVDAILDAMLAEDPIT
ncbi:suppressor of glycerol defect [Diatrype stigma]|uniref:Suppressor of glycerol defect n=1 Tax=Diatrype stigma TaxID=117547 RepID=A0AAN9UU09_9PEZI